MMKTRRCKCRCGEITSPGEKWVKGHWIRNNQISYSESRVGENNPNYKHGLSGHKVYHVWRGMKGRCYNSNHKSYLDYGGRGIKVYIRWRLNFKSFYNWSITHGYKEGLSIDRIDNNGNYHPDNCRFVTCQVNQNNKRPERLSKNNSTGYKGVSFHKRVNKYIARCFINQKQNHLGYFNTPKEAAKVIEKFRLVIG